MNDIQSRARAHHERIRANVDDLYAKRIDHAEFGRRARALHAAVRADGPDIDAAVLDLIVASLPRHFPQQMPEVVR